MSTSPNPQHEPTMEEILASIRKIISEDQPEPAKAAPQEPGPVRAASAEKAPEAEADVLELTQEFHEEEAVVSAAPPQRQSPIENDVAFETIDSEPEAASDMDQDDLISDSARSAMDRAFANLESPVAAASSGGALDSLFLRAIQDSFTPTLQEWVDGHQPEILEKLKPLIREWMDENLPSLIEGAVTRELARAAAAANRPRRR